MVKRDIKGAATVTVGLVMLLAGCGGGGGSSPSGGGGSTSSGNSSTTTSGTPVAGSAATVSDGAISATNAETVARQALAPLSITGLLLDSRSDAGLAQLHASARRAYPQARGGVTSMDCPHGGTLTWTLNQADPTTWNAGDSWSYTANQCRLLPTEQEDGQISWQVISSSGAWNFGGVGSVSARVTFNRYKVTDSASGQISEAEFYGVVDFTQTNTSTTTAITVSGSGLQIAAVDKALSLRITANNLSQGLTINLGDSGYNATLDYTLRLESPTHPSVNGTYLVKTSPSLRGTYNRVANYAEAPTSGGVKVTGANRASVAVNALTGGYAEVKVDANGDGVAESVTTPYWDDLVPY